MICGVDVSSQFLDVRVGRDGVSAHFDNDAEGIVQLAEFCQLHQVHLVVMEATGGYEQLVFGCFGPAGSKWPS